MNGTQSTIGATFCGIVLANGKDCSGEVAPDAPLNLCTQHFAEAFDWQRRVDTTVRQILRCPLCGEEAAVAGETGMRCTDCGYISRDFTGSTSLTGAEVEAINYARECATYVLAKPVVDVVYYLRFGDRIKIGTSSNLRNRLMAIPHDEVLAVELGGRDVERKRHNQFAGTRLRGEWFRDTPQLRHLIGSLTAGQEDWRKKLDILGQ